MIHFKTIQETANEISNRFVEIQEEAITNFFSLLKEWPSTEELAKHGYWMKWTRGEMTFRWKDKDIFDLRIGWPDKKANIKLTFNKSEIAKAIKESHSR